MKKLMGWVKSIAVWFKDAIMESINQVFTLLGFFIAWLTLTGSARDIIGVAIVWATLLWLLTIRLRDKE